MRLPSRQDRSHGQELGFAPGPGVKQALKGQQQGYYDGGQGRHTRPLVVIWSSLPGSYNLSSFCTKSRVETRQLKTPNRNLRSTHRRPRLRHANVQSPAGVPRFGYAGPDRRKKSLAGRVPEGLPVSTVPTCREHHRRWARRLFGRPLRLFPSRLPSVHALVLRVRTIPQRHGDELLRRATLYGTPHRHLLPRRYRPELGAPRPK